MPEITFSVLLCEVFYAPNFSALDSVYKNKDRTQSFPKAIECIAFSLMQLLKVLYILCYTFPSEINFHVL